MRKYFILLFIPFLIGAAPSRVYNYTSGTTIVSSQVEANEDAIFNYLSTGIDTIADNTIVNADINTGAGISDTKLDLATIAQNITFNGTSTFAGTSTFSGQTISSLGTVTTGAVTYLDINSATLDDVEIGRTTRNVGYFSLVDTPTLNATTVNTTNLNPTNLAMTTTVTSILDEDDLSSDSNTALATQQSVKKYVDDNAVALGS